MTPAERWQSYLQIGNDGQPMLRNKIGARNSNDLHAIEYRTTLLREIEIRSGMTEIDRTGDLRQWRAIHRHLFGDIYPFAGELRDVNMSKDGIRFLHYSDVPSFAGKIIDETRAVPWDELDRADYVDAAAWSLAMLNAAHPFREGNGRAARIFFSQLSDHAQWHVNYAAVPKERWANAAKLAMPDHDMNVDTTALRHVLDESVEAVPPPLSDTKLAQLGEQLRLADQLIAAWTPLAARSHPRPAGSGTSGHEYAFIFDRYQQPDAGPAPEGA